MPRNKSEKIVEPESDIESKWVREIMRLDAMDQFVSGGPWGENAFREKTPMQANEYYDLASLESRVRLRLAWKRHYRENPDRLVTASRTVQLDSKG